MGGNADPTGATNEDDPNATNTQQAEEELAGSAQESSEENSGSTGTATQGAQQGTIEFNGVTLSVGTGAPSGTDVGKIAWDNAFGDPSVTTTQGAVAGSPATNTLVQHLQALMDQLSQPNLGFVPSVVPPSQGTRTQKIAKQDIAKAQEKALDQIKDVLQQFNIQVPDDVKTVQQLSNLPLSKTFLATLQQDGYDTQYIANVGDLVATGGKPRGRQQTTTTNTAKQTYTQLLNQYTQHPNDMVAELSAAGLLAPQTGTYSSTQISHALQSLASASVSNNVTPSSILGAAVKQSGLQGLPSDQYTTDVENVAQEFFGPNWNQYVSQTQLNGIANEMQAQGYSGDSDEADAYARMAMTNLANAQNFNVSDNDLGGYVGVVQRYMQNVYGEYGLSPTNSSFSGALNQVLSSGVDSIYSVQDAAQDFAQNSAIAQASSMFPGWAQQLQGGQTIQELISPYASVASNVLGTDENQYTTGPLDNLMKQAATGGTDGQPMTTTEFQNYLMQQPQYQTSQTAVNRGADLGYAIASLFGLQGSSNAQQGWGTGATGSFNPQYDYASNSAG